MDDQWMPSQLPTLKVNISIPPRNLHSADVVIVPLAKTPRNRANASMSVRIGLALHGMPPPTNLAKSVDVNKNILLRLYIAADAISFSFI